MVLAIRFLFFANHELLMLLLLRPSQSDFSGRGLADGVILSVPIVEGIPHGVRECSHVLTRQHLLGVIVVVFVVVVVVFAINPGGKYVQEFQPSLGLR